MRASVLVVTAGAASPRRGELMIPLADRICVEIDPAARRIVIDPPEGLLDL
jgi:ribosomal 30S subunit maturation factor RimM